MMDDMEQQNEYRIQAYSAYLKGQSEKELFEFVKIIHPENEFHDHDYIEELDKEGLLILISEICGNDGRDDPNFDY